MKILILAAFCLSTLNAFACSCMMPEKIETVVKNAELILQGKVLNNYSDNSSNYSVNRVYKVLQDKVGSRSFFEKTFKIQFFHSRNSSAACGVNLETESQTDYIAIFPKLERSEYDYALPPIYEGVSSCSSHLYIRNIGSSADAYRYVLSLLEK